MYKTDFDTKTASLLLNSPSARKQSFEKLLEYILTFSLDGVNFDFENNHALAIRQNAKVNLITASTKNGLEKKLNERLSSCSSLLGKL